MMSCTASRRRLLASHAGRTPSGRRSAPVWRAAPRWSMRRTTALPTPIPRRHGPDARQGNIDLGPVLQGVIAPGVVQRRREETQGRFLTGGQVDESGKPAHIVGRLYRPPHLRFRPPPRHEAAVGIPDEPRRTCIYIVSISARSIALLCPRARLTGPRAVPGRAAGWPTAAPDRPHRGPCPHPRGPRPPRRPAHRGTAHRDSRAGASPPDPRGRACRTRSGTGGPGEAGAGGTVQDHSVGSRGVLLGPLVRSETCASRP
jgi:hypothetical protein